MRAPWRTRGPVAGLALALIAAAALAPHARAQTVTDVDLSRVKPKKEKHETLRFLKENRAFIRARFDQLREKTVERRGDALAMDPRFLAYPGMLAGILAAGDSVSSATEAQARRELLASVTELGDLEARLDQMEQLLAAQRDRLAVLQSDFTGTQKTALMVVLKGYPSDAPVSDVAIAVDDGPTVRVSLSPEQREALQKGGVVQLLHAFVEPRELVLEVTLAGDAWPSGDSGYVTIEPARDRLTMLQLDLSPVHPDRGSSGMHAGTWLHDTSVPTVDG
jgi:hypothetical protein